MYTTHIPATFAFDLVHAMISFHGNTQTYTVLFKGCVMFHFVTEPLVRDF